MADDEERRRIVSELEARASAEWPQPRAVVLDGPGPFELPLCGHVSALGTGAAATFVLMLETAKGDQPVRIPILSNELPALKGTIEWLYSQFVASLPDKGRLQ